MRKIPQRLEAVACDLDGSLYNSSRKVSPMDLITISKLKSMGIPVFICTGRAYHFTKDAVGQVGKDLPICCCNGGHVLNPATNETLYSRPIDKALAMRVLNYLVEQDIPYIIYTTDQVIFRDDKMDRYVHWARENNKVCEGNKVKMSFMCDDDVDLENSTIIKFLLAYIDEKQEAKFKADMNSDGALNCVISEVGVLDVNSAGTNKGDGVKFLAEYIGFSPENTLAMGDNFNDLDMLKTCGVAVVPEGGTEGAKALADFITCDNNNSPLTYAIEHLFPDLLK